MNKGRIVQVMGPVVDVVFEDGNLPYIKDALEVENNGKKCIMEVAQHLGNNEVRCLMLAASEGLHKDMEVTATGAGIKVPVGEKTLGRLFNVLGETIDNGEQIEDAEKWVIHREPPTFEDQSPVVEILETGIKVIDLLAPYAKGGKIGLFELAHRGTIFLDEIGEIPITLQAKLLRVLQEKEIRRIGSTSVHPIDVRVVSATNINIEEKIRSGQFRSDLYYRLNLLDISIPPLRERREDVQELVDFYLTRFACEMGKRIPTVTPEAAQLLMQYDWPGNVRELRNVCERLIVLNDSDFVSAELLRQLKIFRESKAREPVILPEEQMEDTVYSRLKPKKKKKELAEELGVSRTTLWRMAKRQSELEQKQREQEISKRRSE